MTSASAARVVATECLESKQCAEEQEAPRCPSEDEDDSEDSNDTDEGAVQDRKRRVSFPMILSLSFSFDPSPRKYNVLILLLPPPQAPEIDWRSITDPAERRRQRRLAKNRLTAAKSRERKKVCLCLSIVFFPNVVPNQPHAFPAGNLTELFFHA